MTTIIALEDRWEERQELEENLTAKGYETRTFGYPRDVLREWKMVKHADVLVTDVRFEMGGVVCQERDLDRLIKRALKAGMLVIFNTAAEYDVPIPEQTGVRIVTKDIHCRTIPSVIEDFMSGRKNRKASQVDAKALKTILTPARHFANSEERLLRELMDNPGGIDARRKMLEHGLGRLTDEIRRSGWLNPTKADLDAMMEGYMELEAKLRRVRGLGSGKIKRLVKRLQ